MINAFRRERIPRGKSKNQILARDKKEKKKKLAYAIDDDSFLFVTKEEKIEETTTQRRPWGAINNNKRRQQLTIALHDLQGSYGRTANENKNEIGARVDVVLFLT